MSIYQWKWSPNGSTYCGVIIDLNVTTIDYKWRPRHWVFYFNQTGIVKGVIVLRDLVMITEMYVTTLHRVSQKMQTYQIEAIA